MAKVTDSADGESTPETPALLLHDATVEAGPDLPEGFTRIGTVTYWNRSPSFGEVAVHLDPAQDIEPGQFLGVWHGRRGRHLITVVQAANAFEVNPNEEPALAAAREALGLSRSYGREGVSTRIFRLAECST